LATLDSFAERDVLGASRKTSAVIEAGLVRLKELPYIAALRGERGGMVWGIETRDFGDKTAAEWANALVLACYRGRPEAPEGDGIHLLGALAKKVVRVSPPLTISEAEARTALELMRDSLQAISERPPVGRAAAKV
jgi:4-aminobutyrate aminotransferase-like enzyme